MTVDPRPRAGRLQIEQCECGHDLRDNVGQSTTPTQLWVSTLIASDGAKSNGVGPDVAGTSIAALSQLVRTLCDMNDPTATGPRRNAAGPRSVQEAMEFLSPLEALLADWPSGFSVHVRHRVAAANPAATTLNTSLGRWYLRIKAACVTGPLQPFLTPIIQVAATEFPGIVGLDAAGELGLGNRSHVLLKHAVKALGVKRDRLIEGLQSGSISGRTKKLGARSLVHEVLSSEVDRIREARGRWTDEATACQVLGVSPAVFRNLIASGAVQADTDWRNDLFKGGPVEKASLARLDATLHAFHDPLPAVGEVIELRDLTSRRLGDKRALLEVFRAIGTGALCHVGKTGHAGVGKLKYRLDEVRRYFGTPILEAGMSLHALTTMTGWKYESVSHWIQGGLLDAEALGIRQRSSGYTLHGHESAGDQFDHKVGSVSIVSTACQCRQVAGPFGSS